MKFVFPAGAAVVVIAIFISCASVQNKPSIDRELPESTHIPGEISAQEVTGALAEAPEPDIPDVDTVFAPPQGETQEEAGEGIVLSEPEYDFTAEIAKTEEAAQENGGEGMAEASGETQGGAASPEAPGNAPAEAATEAAPAETPGAEPKAAAAAKPPPSPPFKVQAAELPEKSNKKPEEKQLASAAPAALPPLPARIPPTETSRPYNTGESDNDFSREARALTGQLIEIPFRGTGWVFLGERNGKRGLSYDSQKFDSEGQVFVFKADNSGTYYLKFNKQDLIDNYYLKDTVKITVLDRDEGIKSSYGADRRVVMERGEGVNPLAASKPPQNAGENSAPQPAENKAQNNAPQIAANNAPQNTDTNQAQDAGSNASQNAGPPQGGGNTAQNTRSAARQNARNNAPQSAANNASRNTETQAAQNTGTKNRQDAGAVAGNITGDKSAGGQNAGNNNPQQDAGSTNNGAGAQDARGTTAGAAESNGNQTTDYLAQARDDFKNSKFGNVISDLDNYGNQHSSMDDECWWMLGQSFEAKSPARNIKSALDAYQHITREFPQSKYYNPAKERIAYINKFYFDIK